MRNPDLAIYLAHAAFYSVFGVRAFGRVQGRPATAGSELRPGASEGYTAPFSRALIVFHGFGFAVLYSGIGKRSDSPSRAELVHRTTDRRERGDRDGCITRGLGTSFLSIVARTGEG